MLGQVFTLPGPTGESNRYQLLPRGTVWACAKTTLGLVHQLAATLASGNTCWLSPAALGSGAMTRLLEALPTEVQARVSVRPSDAVLADDTWSCMLFEGDADELQALNPRVAQRTGAIARIENLTTAQLAAGAHYDLSALMHEQSISINTAAAGGNAQLMTMG